MRLSDFDYFLPGELVAQSPTAERTDSRLLHVDGIALSDRMFAELPSLVVPGDVLVFNDTRVIKARLFGHKASGGQVEILVERLLPDNEAVAFLRASKATKTGSRIRIAPDIDFEVLGRSDDLFHLRCHAGASLTDVLDAHGQLPLPPYITHAPDAADESRYQTVYAAQPGAVAAPTAGLHFDRAMLDRLDARGVNRATVTLHVGAGTFQPVRLENLAEHRMHSERYSIPDTTVQMIARARQSGKRVIAIGTTSLRALEAAAASGQLAAGKGETDLFITPGYRFHIVDRLLTNFHLPKSTLLMLVSAFVGPDTIRRAYQHAISQRYRFFSYGDAMLLERSPAHNTHAI
ncbi:MAG: tRNA preQ1(34) S-adenosylmethionine ribosyltransferase-isomerase QueA [Thiobacillaceae bacterium]